MAALLAIVSSLMWGTSDFLGGLATRRLHVLAVYGLSQAVGFVVLVVAATAAGGWAAEPGYWPWAISASLLGMTAMIAFYSALSIGPMGIVSPLVALSVVVPVVVSFVRGEVPAMLQFVGIMLALIGILLASGPELTGAETAKPLLLAGVACLGFGGMFVLMAEGSKHDPLMTMTGMRVTTVVVFAAVLLGTRTLGGAGLRDVPLLSVIGVLDASANVAFGFATTLGLLSVTAVLGDLYPVVTVVLAALVLRERLRPVQYIGVSASLFGVLLIASGG